MNLFFSVYFRYVTRQSARHYARRTRRLPITVMQMPDPGRGVARRANASRNLLF